MELRTLEVCAAVCGVIILWPVLVFRCAYYLEFLAGRLQFSFLDQNVLLRCDQLHEQNKD